VQGKARQGKVKPQGNARLKQGCAGLLQYNRQRHHNRYCTSTRSNE